MNESAAREELIEHLRKAKEYGFSDRQLTYRLNKAAGERRYKKADLRRLQYDLGIEAVLRRSVGAELVSAFENLAREG